MSFIFWYYAAYMHFSDWHYWFLLLHISAVAPIGHAFCFFVHSVFAISLQSRPISEAVIMDNVDIITVPRCRRLKRIRMLHVRIPITRYRDLHFAILCDATKLTKFYESFFSERNFFVHLLHSYGNFLVFFLWFRLYSIYSK